MQSCSCGSTGYAGSSGGILAAGRFLGARGYFPPCPMVSPISHNGKLGPVPEISLMQVQVDSFRRIRPRKGTPWSCWSHPPLGLDLPTQILPVPTFHHHAASAPNLLGLASLTIATSVCGKALGFSHSTLATNAVTKCFTALLRLRARGICIHRLWLASLSYNLYTFFQDKLWGAQRILY